MTAARFELPSAAHGAELLWWQETGSLHTLISLSCDVERINLLPEGSLINPTLHLAWLNPDGICVHRITLALDREDSLFIDSARLDLRFGPLPPLVDGLLTIWVETGWQNGLALLGSLRLQPFVDWYSDVGDAAALHSDQFSISRPDDKPRSVTGITEIAFVETAASKTSLVFLIGSNALSAGCLSLSVINADGERMDATYPHPMPAFSRQSIRLADLLPGLAEFCGGRHAVVEGRFDNPGLYSRPYVITETQHAKATTLSGYHGGDLYQWCRLPGFVHRWLGRGETNPMLALQDATRNTTVNLFNSHGDLEADFAVDARLYDCDGTLIAERERWLIARRHQLVRGEIAELLPHGFADFCGHIALSFSDNGAAFYPHHLQALMEYRGTHDCARVMAWSDVWNAREQMQKLSQTLDVRLRNALLGSEWLPRPEAVFRSRFRAWCEPARVSYFSFTNHGTEPGYSRSAELTLWLEDGRGRRLRSDRSLLANATAFGTIETFFPQALEFLDGQPWAMLMVESASDLASMHFTEHRPSGALSAEHFMDIGGWHEGHLVSGCGS